mmetsp:Transcript_22910/g.78380  ORF Transcript_22910/g.78380 Transcript_22910/m.78380 type:complete len:334 (-) Transcript_22910:320-1321(-)
MDGRFVISATAERTAAILAAINAKFPTKGARVLGAGLEGDADLLAMDAARNAQGDVSLSMATFERGVINRLGYGGATSAKTPLEAKWHADFTDDPGAAHGARPRKWDDPREVLGLLTFAAYILRADFAFAVSALGTAVSIWSPKHDQALGRVVRYLKGTIGKMITFAAGCEINLTAAADAGFGGELFADGSPDRARSRVAGVIFLSHVPLYFFTVRTKTTPTSTFEAELIALVRLLRSLVIVRTTVMMLFGKDNLPPTRVSEDNMALILALRRRVISGRARHVRVSVGYVLDVLDAGHAIIVFVTTKAQIANGLTKAETKEELDRTCAAFFSN